MMRMLQHRGPDAGDHWISEQHNLLLAHRRLSIQDLSPSGSQPMHSSSGRYCIVFNGEIYNFLEISDTLKSCGYHFTGHSDTEVMLAAFDEWGLRGALQRFIGMFAFAVWDLVDEVLHLCRDRMGEKPLYYGWHGGVFCFASELCAIEAISEGLVIDPDSLAAYLHTGYIPAPMSIYRNIYKLPPATLLSVGVDALRRKPDFSPVSDYDHLSPVSYWSVWSAAREGIAHRITDEREAIEGLNTLLRNTVRRQLTADVSVGTFLSGGIDSSLVTAVAQHESADRIRTYTIGFDEKEYDESAHALSIARHLGTDHMNLRVQSSDALELVPSLATIYSEPFADSSQIPTFLLSKLAREHVTVCLSGDGGDELFAGYNRYVSAYYLWRRFSVLPPVLRRLVGRALALPATGFWDAAYALLHGDDIGSMTARKLVGLKMQKLAGFIQQEDIQLGYQYLLSLWNKPGDVMQPEVGSSVLVNPPLDCAGFIEQALYQDQVAYLPGDNLTKVDMASMAASLETRLPLLSHEVVEYSWRLPSSMKLHGRSTKWILRQLLYRYVPKELIERPKMGFSVPVDKWLRGELRDWSADLLTSAETISDGLLREDTLSQYWHEHVTGYRDHSHRLWAVLMFLSWAHARKRTPI